jgi:hypothetical protein
MHIGQTSSEDNRNKKKSEQQIDGLYVLTEPIDTYNKIVIDINEVTDFSFCPSYYEFKNSNKNEINLRTLYDKALHKTIYSYLLALQENRLENTLEFLKYKWGKEWINYKNIKELLITISSYEHDTYEKKRKKGIDAIFKFNDIMLKERQFPIIIGHKYQVEILPNIVLTGTLEYVRELTLDNGQKVIQVVKFSPEPNRFYTNMAKLYSLDLISMSYAFNEIFNVDYFQSVFVDIESKKVTTNVYNKSNYDLLKKTVKSTVMCLQNGIKCVSPDYRCYCCEYRTHCLNKM